MPEIIHLAINDPSNAPLVPPPPLPRTAFLAKAVVSHDEAKRVMREHGHTDLSRPDVEQWRNVFLNGYAHRISRYKPASVRKKAFKEMGEDLVNAILETQVRELADGRTLEWPETVQDTIQSLLEDRDSQYRGFSDGWYSQLSGKSSEDVKSICSTAGFPEPFASTCPSISDC